MTRDRDAASPRSVAVYARISQDRAGAGLGVQRQVEDCEALAAREGWTVVEVYQDNDVSAYGSRVRPSYTRMMDDARSGLFEGIVVWHVDRLTRSARDLEDVIDLGVPVHAVTAGHVDLTTASGRAVARTLAAWARYESDHKSERLVRKHEELATGGAWVKQRSYGYTAEGQIVDEEAAIIRLLADRFLAGESLRSLVTWLNDNGVPTLRGGTWRSATLRALLPAARLSAQREYTPRSKGRGYGLGEIVAKGDWEPILTPRQTDQIRARLTDPTRRTSVARRHLLSGGIIRCGRCGSPLNRRSDPRSGDRYQCIRLPGSNRCGRLSVVAGRVEELVQVMILKAVLDTPVEDAQDQPEDLSSELDDIEARRIEAAQAFAAGVLSLAEWAAVRDGLEARAEALRGSAKPSRAAVALTRGWDDLVAWWDQAPLDHRRALILAMCDGVIVDPAARPGQQWDDRRVRILWR